MNNSNLQITNEYATLLREKLGNKVEKIYLFGSRARNDFSHHSDFDVLVVVSQKTPEIREQIIESEVEMLDQYETLFATFVYTPSEWEKEQNYPFGWNVIQDGLEV